MGARPLRLLRVQAGWWPCRAGPAACDRSDRTDESGVGHDEAL